MGRAPPTRVPAPSVPHAHASAYHRNRFRRLTTIDLRGHGRSEVTDGPYTVELLAADVAAVLRTIHGDDVRIHLNGCSLGYGVCLSIAFNYPDMVLTVSGNGFLTNQLTAKGRWFKKMVFKESMTRSMGLEKLGRQAGGAAMVDLMSHIDINGYVAASTAWLWYDESDKLHKLSAPLLWIWPAGQLISIRRALHWVSSSSAEELPVCLHVPQSAPTLHCSRARFVVPRD